MNPIIICIFIYFLFKCDGQPVTNLSANSNTTIQISTKYPLRLSYNDTEAEKPYLWCGYVSLMNNAFQQNRVCKFQKCKALFRYFSNSYSFNEHGRYGMNISKNHECSVYTLYEPWNPYLRKCLKLLGSVCLPFEYLKYLNFWFCSSSSSRNGLPTCIHNNLNIQVDHQYSQDIFEQDSRCSRCRCYYFFFFFADNPVSHLTKLTFI